MNFFGHAAIAGRFSPSPAFALGAMLPDLAAMIGARPPSSVDDDVSRGVELHHATDAAFHDLAAFRELVAGAERELRARGLSRGSARAAAHVGVELLLDGELAGERGSRDLYLRAVRAGGLLRAGRLLAWRPEAARLRFEALRLAMLARGVRREHSTAPVIARRVGIALEGRSRLALASGDELHVSEWAAAAAPRVRSAAPGIVASVLGALRGGGTNGGSTGGGGAPADRDEP
ncbi:MAG: hypothetical protein IT376_02350 [Polyangiaceae bacterium]|nr:hypothetical protein [Polyangiaceae bacterium]